METIERSKIKPEIKGQTIENTPEISSSEESTRIETMQDFVDYSCLPDTFSKEVKLIDSSRLHMDAKYGSNLEILKNGVKRFRARKSLDYLRDYINQDYTGRVCILYGLRRTGKTTLLFQLLNYLDPNKTVYIKAKEQNTMGDLIKDIDYLSECGITNFLVDEVTLLSDFINSAASLSDIYCQMGYKVILSGTDSLGFDFAKRDELYDRAVTIHTSYISFKEFSRVLGKDDVDEYIEFGGTLQKENMGFGDEDYSKEDVSFRDDESTRKYIDSAISQNIQRSLRNERFGSRFYHLRELYDKNELTNVINRIVESMNHEFLLRVVERAFISHDLGSARQMLLHEKDKTIHSALYDIDESTVVNTLKKLIDIKEKSETTVPVTEGAMNQIKEYLYDLDLIKDVEIRNADGTIEKRIVFTQPGMRYSIAKALVYSLMQDAYFSKLSEGNKDVIINKILNDVKGRMLEDIVLLESTYRKKKDEVVFKYVDNHLHAECDMVKYNRRTNSFVIYEVKHSNKIDAENQAKHLNNKDFLLSLSKKYGVLKKKCILYKGKVAKEVGTVTYLNVEHYLRSI